MLTVVGMLVSNLIVMLLDPRIRHADDAASRWTHPARSRARSVDAGHPLPRPRGDVGNATTWPFPVRYKIVKGAAPHRVVGEPDPDLLWPFIDGARELVDDGVFANVYSTKQPENEQPVADSGVLERELVDAAGELLAEQPDVGAIVMECANFVPYSQGVRRATGLPVFDLYTLVMNAYEATTGTDFPS